MITRTFCLTWILVVPSLDIIAARADTAQSTSRGARCAPSAPFFAAIATSVQDRDRWPGAPYPPSELIQAVEWSPADTVIRQADGSDNWPITWADDDHLYTAYGDGWGFVPKVDKKLSLGFAKVAGGPEEFTGVNIRTETGERQGDGHRGPKASGMLFVDGVLTMLVRNTGNAQLAWSEDYARTWRWSDWKFETSFGVPTFLNFGKNYAGARDDYVYSNISGARSSRRARTDGARAIRAASASTRLPNPGAPGARCFSPRPGTWAPAKTAACLRNG